MIRITIPLQLPGLNEYVNVCRNNRYKAAKFKRSVENDCIIFIRAALKGRMIECGGFTFHWYEPNQRRDKDNICFAKKFVMDALQKSQVMKNDGWKQVAYFKDEFDVDKENPRVEILIEEIA